MIIGAGARRTSSAPQAVDNSTLIIDVAFAVGAVVGRIIGAVVRLITGR